MNEICPLDQRNQRCERTAGHGGSHSYPDRLIPLTIDERYAWRAALADWLDGKGPHPAWKPGESIPSPDGTRWDGDRDPRLSTKAVDTAPVDNVTALDVDKRKVYQREWVRRKREREDG